jgi:16S rRNA (adenine1518-N6/adenine1519-N6)-dimethyltransferase
MKRTHPSKNLAFPPKKSLGQNFLTSDIVPKWLCDAGEITKNDTVLEIGPGTGVLTKELLERGANVTAIETDTRALAVLKEMFSNEITHNKLHLIDGDVRKFDFNTLNLQKGQYKVIANIPYYLSGFLLRILLEHQSYPQCIVFLMQRELVQRIAREKKESLLSLGVKSFGTPYYYKTVGRGHFNPVPKVDSAILRITNISHTHFNEKLTSEFFFKILHLGFGKKRKQLLVNLSDFYDREVAKEALLRANVSPQARAEDISLEKWLQIVKNLSV